VPDHLDEELSQRQAELQEEAGTVTADLRLVQALSAVGEPMTVGSAALGLMVWRDRCSTITYARPSSSHSGCSGGQADQFPTGNAG